MNRAPITELKAKLSYFLDRVRHGQEIVVTDRGRAIARISPIRGVEEAESRRDELIRTGRLRPPVKKLDKAFWKLPRPKDPTGRGLDVLLDERREGR
jgi:prevent-host-death family protein